MTPIKKLNASAKILCVTSCRNVSDCVSVNFNYRLKEENCELLSENSYENLTNLVRLSGWMHFTTYVSSMLFNLYLAFVLFFFAFAISLKILTTFS